MKILYQGLLRSPTSWARVGREYVDELIRLGHDLTVVSPRGFLWNADFPAPAAPEATPEEAREAHSDAIGLGFLHPTTLDRLVGDIRANFFVWESDRVPETWIEPLAALDVVVVPSRFTRDALLSSGMPPDRVEVACYGYRPSEPRSEPEAMTEPGGPFTFLCVASPHWRKGLRELARAYREAFSARDGVRLMIKTTYDPGTRRSRAPFEIPSWRALLESCDLDDHDAPELRIDVSQSPDDAMDAFYAGADVAVQPSWGESFGLAILDAFARGLPVIATGSGGHVEFAPPGPDLVPFVLSTDERGLYEPVAEARVALPSIDAIAARMRWHFEHRDESREIGRRARARVAHLTWTNATKELVAVLRRRGINRRSPAREST